MYIVPYTETTSGAITKMQNLPWRTTKVYEQDLKTRDCVKWLCYRNTGLEGKISFWKRIEKVENN